MSTAGRADTDEIAEAGAVATAIREASLVKLVATTDGDAIGAAGLLAGACAETSVPYHVGFAGSRAAVESQVTAADTETTTLTLGTPNPVGHSLTGNHAGGVTQSIALVADEVVRELGSTPDPTMALAGALSAGVSPDDGQAERAVAAAHEDGFERRPGVAIPVEDPVDGLAHSTLLHGAFSGDREATRELIEPLVIAGIGNRDEDEDEDEQHADGVARELASVVALALTEDASERTVGALGRVLHPHVSGGAFRTLGGTADVLSALADRAPGLVVAHALGTDVREPALDAWRAHGEAVHAGIRKAETERYSGLFVARVTDAPTVTVARLLRDYRSPEPTVLVLDEDDGSVAVAGDAPGTGAALASVLEDRAIDRGPLGYALGRPSDAVDPDDLIPPLREATPT